MVDLCRMSLTNEKFLFLDCQTTGMRPPKGQLLEVAWGVGSATDNELSDKKNFLIQLIEPEIPRRIQEITGIKSEDLLNAVHDSKIYDELAQLAKSKKVSGVIIHYAQF